MDPSCICPYFLFLLTVGNNSIAILNRAIALKESRAALIKPPAELEDAGGMQGQGADD